MSPRSKTTSQQMRAESRSTLLRAARKVFAERGYFQCKISDIASEAGMSQGNLYWYFSGKEDLLEAVLADGFETLGAIMQQGAAGEGTCLQKLDRLLEAYIAFNRERGAFVTIFVSMLSHGGAPLLKELGFDLEQIGTGYHRSLAALFQQGQAEGVIPAGADPQVLVMYYFAFFNGLIITYGADGMELPAGELRAAIQRLLGMQTS